MEKNNFLIPVNGLPQGLTKFEGVAGKEFFEGYGNEEIFDASIVTKIVIEKSGQYTGVDCEISGEVVVECDRCLEPLKLPVNTEAKLSIKYGKSESEQSEDDDAEREVIWLTETDADLDLSQIIYDYVCLSLPAQRIHEEGECNPVVLKYLDEGIKISGENVENPFSVLSGMFDKK